MQLETARWVTLLISSLTSTSLARRGETEGTRVLMQEWDCLILGEDQILRGRKGDNLQLLLSQKYHRVVLKQLHNEMRHLGSSRVFQLAQDRFFWPQMQRDIELQLFKTEKTQLC